MSEKRIEQLRRIQDFPAIIADEPLRLALKRDGLIEAAPERKRYRAMPYRVTDKGRRELAAAEALEEKEPRS